MADWNLFLYQVELPRPLGLLAALCMTFSAGSMRLASIMISRHAVSLRFAKPHRGVSYSSRGFTASCSRLTRLPLRGEVSIWEPQYTRNICNASAQLQIIPPPPSPTRV